ncbi:sugar phosphate nucleotidyltransferase [Fictibacillus enclensis]|uniref:sugar phosphate nucleotidyltransferase n=1 Tax=Fictibacillus enclensis TaxID=1017270 RepID=UPI0025A05668|nr:sugar phosphate nucleotidyltransferase [Fictibacillus enclensis]MDM5340409.1 sugar phosphate nucleotidyltransferase [Fictibacillus enclensis]
MKLVLLSGGSGKRLWPLSNDARSKQFLKVLNSRVNENESMIQRVWSQLEAVHLSESSLIATNGSQVDMIQNQIGPDVPLIVEPARRDTFPAVALAATYLFSVLGSNLNEVVAILPVDPFVDREFFQRVKDLELLLRQSEANLALLGIKPTYPSEKYGYMVPELGENNSWMRINSFYEKPKKQLAETLIEKKALWNSGVFAFKLGYLLSLLEEKGFPIEYHELLKEYGNLPKISFDYEVVEQEEQIAALSYDGYWKDLGTWNTLTEEMGIQKIGKGILHHDCDNTHLINELDIPVTVVGVNDVIVAASPDGILVADKKQSPHIKDLVQTFEMTPRYEERSWGSYKVLDDTLAEDGQSVVTKRLKINAGGLWEQQLPTSRSEVWTIISGKGELILNKEVIGLGAGKVLELAQHSLLTLRALTNMVLISTQKASYEIKAEEVLQEYESPMKIVNY